LQDSQCDNSRPVICDTQLQRFKRDMFWWYVQSTLADGTAAVYNLDNDGTAAVGNSDDDYEMDDDDTAGSDSTKYENGKY